MHVFILLCCLSCGPDAADSLNDRLERWTQQDSPNLDARIEYRSPGDPTQARWSYRSGNHEVDTVSFETDDRKSEIVRIVNPQYGAKLENGIDSKWVLTALHIAGTPGYDEFVAEGPAIDKLRRSVVAPGGYPAQLKENLSHFDVRQDSTDGKDIFTVTCPGEVVAPFDIFQKIQLTFGEHDGPEGFEFERGKSQSRWSFTDWVDIDGKVLPSAVMTLVRSDPNTEWTLNQHLLVTYEDHSPPFDPEMCYLRYYGLPEPEGVSSETSWWITGPIMLLVIITVVLLRRRLP